MQPGTRETTRSTPQDWVREIREDNYPVKRTFSRYRTHAVFFSASTNERFNVRQWIGAVLFLFLFALPLHFHSASNSQQVRQECSCSCGGLSQLGSAPEPAVLSITFQAFFAYFSRAETLSDLAVESECARAPPVSSL